MLPGLAYVSELWNGCTEFEKQKVESIPLEAARIACGLPIFCKKETILNKKSLVSRLTWVFP